MLSISKKKITADLKRTGFPLEVFVQSELEKRDWMIYSGSLYRDEETGQARELDTHGVKVDYEYADKTTKKVGLGDANKLISHLIVQCKKSEKPWIFFDNGKAKPSIPEECLKSKKGRFHVLWFNDLERIGLKKFCFKNALIHKSFHESFSDPKQSSKIYEALITVVKATKYIKKRYGLGKYVLHYFIPIIVLDGTLWSATLNKNLSVRIKRVSKLFTVFEILPRPDAKGRCFEEEYVIEVMTREYFSKGLTEIERDNKELYKCWTNFINASPKKMRKLFPKEKFIIKNGCVVQKM